VGAGWPDGVVAVSEREGDVAGCLERRPDVILATRAASTEAIRAARRHPDVDFVLVNGLRTTVPNVLTVLFADQQAAFLAGYLAAARSVSHRVGTLSSRHPPGPGLLLNGFAAGVRAYAREAHRPTRLLGWDPSTRQGLVARSTAEAENATKELISDGADVILVDAGPFGVGAARLALAVGHVTLVWTGVDGCRELPRYCVLFLTSVEKRPDVALRSALRRVADGSFSGGTYIGTLANGGVALAPFHLHDTEIPGEIRDRLTELAAHIANGSVSVDPGDYLNP
jgi:basic membrane protein A